MCHALFSTPTFPYTHTLEHTHLCIHTSYVLVSSQTRHSPKLALGDYLSGLPRHVCIFFFHPVKPREKAPLLSSVLHTQPLRVVCLPWPIVVSHFGEVTPLNLLASQIFPLAGRFFHFGLVAFGYNTRPAAAPLVLIASDASDS